VREGNVAHLLVAFKAAPLLGMPLERAYLSLESAEHCSNRGARLRVEVARLRQRFAPSRLRSYRLPRTELPVALGELPFGLGDPLRVDITELLQPAPQPAISEVSLLLRLRGAAGQLACLAAFAADAPLPKLDLYFEKVQAISPVATPPEAQRNQPGRTADKAKSTAGLTKKP
jgi:hypothetical protein